MRVHGTKQLNNKLRTLITQQRKQQHLRVVVGYSAPYAMFVHEAVAMVLQGQPRTGRVAYKTKTGKLRHKRHRGFFWDPQGQAQAKFLETPARDPSVQAAMRAIIEAAMAKNVDQLRRALLRAGNVLKKASQQMVPVEFGVLKKSAFVEVE